MTDPSWAHLSSALGDGCLVGLAVWLVGSAVARAFRRIDRRRWARVRVAPARSHVRLVPRPEAQIIEATDRFRRHPSSWIDPKGGAA